MTEGILVRRLQRDASLEGTGLVVLDEVHERSVHTDLALALALDARTALCPDLRLLAMSATLDTGRLAAALGSDGVAAPVVASTGRAFAVDVRWAPPRDRERLDAHVARVVAAALRSDAGDVLVFLPGAADIRRAATALGRAGLSREVDVRPLFGSLPRDEQDRALAPSPPGRRRVVLATDIAESSLTVAGVRIVVDAGLARVPRLDPRSGLTRLVTVTASKASAEQRAGRAGRTSPGVAHRLWSKVEHAPAGPLRHARDRAGRPGPAGPRAGRVGGGRRRAAVPRPAAGGRPGRGSSAVAGPGGDRRRRPAHRPGAVAGRSAPPPPAGPDGGRRSGAGSRLGGVPAGLPAGGA